MIFEFGHKRHCSLFPVPLICWFSRNYFWEQSHYAVRDSNHAGRPSACSSWQPRLSPALELFQPGTTEVSGDAEDPHPQALESFQVRPWTSWSWEKPPTMPHHNPWLTKTIKHNEMATVSCHQVYSESYTTSASRTTTLTSLFLIF